MDKSSDDVDVLFNEAMALHNAGMFQKALPKLKSALAMAEKVGDDQSVMGLSSWIITCHHSLGQVSGVKRDRITEKLTDVSSSLSLQKCSVYVIRWSR